MTDTSAPRYKAPPDRDLVPRVMIRAMLGLVLAVLALVTYARLTDAPLVATPPDSEIVLERHVFLSGTMGGAATILDANGTLIANLSPEEGGFIAGVSRVLDRERAKHGVALTGPVTIIARKDGRLSVYDPSTGWGADLMGFGQTNSMAFTKLLTR
ncbi:MAG: pullulanase [Roseovarius sp.]|jgi:putative photosynthetic complex assembly protein|uniref:photosynthetic complex assembly protein PuhC n=1 Tax=Roseovarius sp. TaxID=1486281 RepID=UPI001B489836|nr:photosynthetic complex assembly protein PuhC [Roseovarius sp.]MBQ0752367.1 pullulanase [Roseovarius sp.]MBQ0811455.1 pullulanase [Roseovarius sp.]